MRAAILVAPEHLQITEKAAPTPGPEEALLRVEYVALCGSDQERFWEGNGSPHRPVVMGHEFTARVVAAGSHVAHLELGQLVTAAPLLNCGRCDFCREGRENLCRRRQVFGQDVDGALQEYVTVPASRVYPLPPGMSATEGALIEPLAVACHAVRRAGSGRCSPAVALGAGTVGLLIAQVWRALGRGDVSVIDIDERRLAVASELRIPAWTGTPHEPGIRTLFEATGSAEAVTTWLPALSPAGRAVIVGKLTRVVEADWVALLRKEAAVVWSRYFTPVDFERAVRLLALGRVDVAPLVGGVVPFARLGERRGRAVMDEAQNVTRLLVRVAGD
jgi:2-desacetyl-2-hydroxyethyl bacteriochlorophyllide A dehydrogenase